MHIPAQIDQSFRGIPSSDSALKPTALPVTSEQVAGMDRNEEEFYLNA
jgi:hypothetical protein